MRFLIEEKGLILGGRYSGLLPYLASYRIYLFIFILFFFFNFLFIYLFFFIFCNKKHYMIHRCSVQYFYNSNICNGLVILHAFLSSVDFFF